MTDLTETREELGPPAGSARELAAPLKVSFYPSTDDLAHISEKINRSYKLPSRANQGLQAFLAFNLVGMPAVLWFFDAYLVGFLVFAINVVVAVSFLPALRRMDYRQYFRAMFGNIENEVVEVELTDEGVWCRRSDDYSFHAWKSIKLLEETKEAIYFFFDHNGIAVAKTGFAYDEEKDLFLAMAKKHVENFEIS